MARAAMVWYREKTPDGPRSQLLANPETAPRPRTGTS